MTEKIGLAELHLGESETVLPTLSSQKFHAIIADLPYGTTNCPWDTPLDLNALWVQYKRLLKPSGVVLMFAKTPFDKVLGCSNLPWLKYEWIWEKPSATGHLNAKKMPMSAHENILVFYDRPPRYFPQKTQGHKPANFATNRIEVQNRSQLYNAATREVSSGGQTDRYPRSVQVFSSDKQRNKLDGTIHSTQKPLALLEYLVRTYTEEGDWVLDSTMGSGTANLACNNLGRNSVGVEKFPEIYDVASRRLKMYL